LEHAVERVRDSWLIFFATHWSQSKNSHLKHRLTLKKEGVRSFFYKRF